MHIYNRTRQTTLATDGRYAQGYLARLRGLMFRKELPEGEALLLEPESSIHTFFMRFPIDVLYLDRSYQVLRADAAMPPNRIGPLVTRGCHAVLELPPGTIAATRTEVGDQIDMGTGS
jgi:uncharacterized membrane protein (UPF0127 family)